MALARPTNHTQEAALLDKGVDGSLQSRRRPGCAHDLLETSAGARTGSQCSAARPAGEEDTATTTIDRTAAWVCSVAGGSGLRSPAIVSSAMLTYICLKPPVALSFFQLPGGTWTVTAQSRRSALMPGLVTVRRGRTRSHRARKRTAGGSAAHSQRRHSDSSTSRTESGRHAAQSMASRIGWSTWLRPLLIGHARMLAGR